MFWMMNGMGPRGPMHGHRGFDRGFGPRPYRPMAGFRPGFGLGGLFLLPALLFGGWMIVAVAGALIGAAVMILGSVFGGLAALAESVFSGLTSAGSIAIGALIGFVLFRRLRARNAEKASAAEETTETYEGSDPDYGMMNSLNNRNG